MTRPKRIALPNHPEIAQTDKFKALAKELECDDTEAAFEKVVKKVAGAKNKSPAKKAGLK